MRHADSNATGRYRNVRREQLLIKFSGVQPNFFRTGWRTQRLSLYTGWVPPATRPDVTGHPYGLRWLAAKSVVAVVVVGVQPGPKNLAGFGVAREPGAGARGAQ
jgi:hypothetical protein